MRQQRAYRFSPTSAVACRKDFAWTMANALVNLGLSMATNPDNRRLAIDMAVVLVNWEKRRIKESGTEPSSPGKRNADQAGIKVTPAPPPHTSSSCTAANGLRGAG